MTLGPIADAIDTISVAAADNGRYAVLWTDYNDSSRGRIRLAVGSLRSGRARPRSRVLGRWHDSLSGAHVVVGPSGEVLALWQHPTASLVGGGLIQGRSISVDGRLGPLRYAAGSDHEERPGRPAQTEIWQLLRTRRGGVVLVYSDRRGLWIRFKSPRRPWFGSPRLVTPVQKYGDIMEASAALTPSGRLALLWLRTEGEAFIETRELSLPGAFGPVSVLARHFLEYSEDYGAVAPIRDPYVGVDDRGDVTAVWRDSRQIRLASRRRGQRFTEAQTIGMSANWDDAGPTLAVGPHGDAAVSWHLDDFSDANTGESPLVARLRTREGTRFGRTIRLGTAIGGQDSVVADASGGFLIGWGTPRCEAAVTALGEGRGVGAAVKLARPRNSYCDGGPALATAGRFGTLAAFVRIVGRDRHHYLLEISRRR